MNNNTECVRIILTKRRQIMNVCMCECVCVHGVCVCVHGVCVFSGSEVNELKNTSTSTPLSKITKKIYRHIHQVRV